MRTELKIKENVILTIRKHWLTLITPIFWCLILLIVSLISFKSEYGIYAQIATLFILVWLAYSIIDRKTNLWVVTNLRVIDEYGVFSVNSKESPLDKINNVSYQQTLVGRIFGFGNVQIQTAAEMGSTLHSMVEKPRLLKDTITKCQDQYRQSQIEEQAQQLANTIYAGQNPKKDIAEELTRLYELKVKGIITEDDFNQYKTRILSQ